MGESPEILVVAGNRVPRDNQNFGPFLLMPEWLQLGLSQLCRAELIFEEAINRMIG
jgi:hypothetical protein